MGNIVERAFQVGDEVRLLQPAYAGSIGVVVMVDENDITYPYLIDLEDQSFWVRDQDIDFL